MPRILSLILSLILLTYPVAVYFGLKYTEPKYIGLLLLALLTGRFLLVQHRVKRSGLRILAIITATGVLLCVLMFAINHQSMVLMTPVLINLILFTSFLYSLYNPPTAIERLARLTNPDLPDNAIKYTRKVTQAWCLFFLINGTIAAYTCFFTNLEIWTLYNGFIAYLLMGILFLTEYCIRRQKMGDA